MSRASLNHILATRRQLAQAPVTPDERIDQTASGLSAAIVPMLKDYATILLESHHAQGYSAQEVTEAVKEGLAHCREKWDLALADTVAQGVEGELAATDNAACFGVRAHQYAKHCLDGIGYQAVVYALKTIPAMEALEGQRLGDARDVRDGYLAEWANRQSPTPAVEVANAYDEARQKQQREGLEAASDFLAHRWSTTFESAYRSAHTQPAWKELVIQTSPRIRKS